MAGQDLFEPPWDPPEAICDYNLSRFQGYLDTLAEVLQPAYQNGAIQA
jgi:hypothetical protein